MKVEIYGKSTGCKWCDRAKMICEMNNIEFDFVDIAESNIGVAELSEIMGVSGIRTVPQIKVDGKYVGGCTEFEKYLNDME